MRAGRSRVSNTGIPAAMAGDITSHAVTSVAALIRPYVRRTPVVIIDRADFGLTPGPLVLKLEQLQHSGSFKARGCSPTCCCVAARRRGGGGVGRQPRRGGRLRGPGPGRAGPDLRPEVSSPAKIARIRGYGADLVVGGAATPRPWPPARNGRRRPALRVPAFDQIETILGAGSLGRRAEAAGARGRPCWPAWVAAGCWPGSARATRAGARHRGRAGGRAHADPGPPRGPARGRGGGQRGH